MGIMLYTLQLKGMLPQHHCKITLGFRFRKARHLRFLQDRFQSLLFLVW